MTKTEILTALTFMGLLGAIWIDSLWVKIPVTVLIVFTIFGTIASANQEQES
jgi:hypothetical protein